MYGEKKIELFKNIHVTIKECKPHKYKNKLQIMFTYIGGKWCINRIGSEHYPMNRPRFSKE